MKKQYMKPSMQSVKVLQSQIVCNSLNSITSEGLGSDLLYDDDGGSQEIAW